MSRAIVITICLCKISIFHTSFTVLILAPRHRTLDPTRPRTSTDADADADTDSTASSNVYIKQSISLLGATSLVIGCIAGKLSLEY